MWDLTINLMRMRIKDGRLRRERRSLRSRSEPEPQEDSKKKQENLWKLRLFLPVMEGNAPVAALKKRSAEDEAADLPTKPTKTPKSGSAISSQTARKAPAISIRLEASKPRETVPTLAPKTLSVAAAFNEDEDSKPEKKKMPPGAKMRMKNIGRDTPTSAGPNSFNKGKHGFSDN